MTVRRPETQRRAASSAGAAGPPRTPDDLPSPLHVEVRGVGKRFGGVAALTNVHLSLERGVVHGLVGENGAGKSTLGRMIAGLIQPDEGTLVVDGQPVHYASPRAALADGITIIAQELLLVPGRTVIENVFLGNSPTRGGVVRTRQLRARYRQLCEQAGFELPAHALVRSLRLADQQKVEILRAIARDSKLIVMDEPTAALSTDQADRLLSIIEGLRDRGTTVVFVSHFLDQVLRVADTVTVLRDGQVVDKVDARTQTADTLVTKMLGRSVTHSFPSRRLVAPAAGAVLSVRGLSRRDAVESVSLDVRAGEIVGVAGLVGAGRSELARLIFGADRRDTGEIYVDGAARRIRSPRDAVRAGIAMLPESRKEQGLLMGASIRRNVSLPHLGKLSRTGVLRLPTERRDVLEITERVGVRGAGIAAPVSALSGGNQQKAMFAKWLVRPPRVLIADEPTRGVDIGAKQTIYQLLADLAADGMAILMISSEIEEVLGLAHRVLVMSGGAVVAEFQGDEMDESAVLQAAFTRGDDST
ncbi:MAG: transporter related protein [Frankiales bacterium]|jgi:ABC-type sugar transport system ATPase subunit|nr:transporter related protein [Frankiales bacterium]